MSQFILHLQILQNSKFPLLVVKLMLLLFLFWFLFYFFVKVRVVYILGKNTSDEVVWEQLQKKHSVVGSTVGVSETFKAHKTSSDIDSKQRTMDSFMNTMTAGCHPPPSNKTSILSSSERNNSIPSYYLTNDPISDSNYNPSVQQIAASDSAPKADFSSRTKAVENNNQTVVNIEQTICKSNESIYAPNKAIITSSSAYFNAGSTAIQSQPVAPSSLAMPLPLTSSSSATSSFLSPSLGPPAGSSSSCLTQEQLERIERNRLAAKEKLRITKLQESQRQQQGLTPPNNGPPRQSIQSDFPLQSSFHPQISSQNESSPLCGINNSSFAEVSKHSFSTGSGRIVSVSVTNNASHTPTLSDTSRFSMQERDLRSSERHLNF